MHRYVEPATSCAHSLPQARGPMFTRGEGMETIAPSGASALVPAAATAGFSEAMARLVRLSVDLKYNAYAEFEWPAALADDQWWMGPELLSVAGTRFERELAPQQLLRLSHWESINLYSLSMYGERDLAQVVLQHIHRGGFEEASEYFHHFVEEENKHMWFFSQFCMRYGGKIYPQKSLKFSDFSEPALRSYLAFAKIMIFEEIGDYYNVRIEADEAIPPFVRHLNRMHHRDEARHLAMARRLLALLHSRARECNDAAAMAGAEAYLKRYMRAGLQSFYCVEAYQDAGIPEPFKLRNALISDPAREQVHQAILKRVVAYLVGSGQFQTEEF
jgi:hypothetical protein